LQAMQYFQAEAAVLKKPFQEISPYSFIPYDPSYANEQPQRLGISEANIQLMLEEIHNESTQENNEIQSDNQIVISIKNNEKKSTTWLLKLNQSSDFSKFDVSLAPMLTVFLTSRTSNPIICDIWLYILTFLDLEYDLKTCFQWSKNPLNKPLGLFFQSHVKLTSLLQEIVYGNLSAAEQIIKAQPNLLLQSGRVEDYSFGMDESNHRKVQGTAYELALRAEDKLMAAMVQHYLRALPGGEAEIIKYKQLLIAQKEQEQEKIAKDLTALAKITAAITVAETNDTCEEALLEFRRYLEPKEVIKNQKHFNRVMLIEAFDLYTKNYSAFGGFNSAKNNLFRLNVIGYIQRFLPAHFAQMFCQGFTSTEEDCLEINRSLIFSIESIFDNDDIYFPLDTDPARRLGYEIAAEISGFVLGEENTQRKGGDSWFIGEYMREHGVQMNEAIGRLLAQKVTMMKTYVELNTVAIEELIQQASHPSISLTS
jgi:hypothetical protein